jgi:cysteinyl-tRNA synthetase
MPGYQQGQRAFGKQLMIKLFNTMSRQVEEFQPQEDNLVKIYTCGPTVYDKPHIGNWYSFLRFEILNRILKASGYQTKWVMNITDVGHLASDDDTGEDKLEKGARREGKSAWEIAEFYTNNFIKDLDRLNFLKPDVLPRATDHIKEQIDLIKLLEDQNLTYKIDDGIYFDTSQLADYGKLAKLDIANLRAGARVEYNKQKHNPTDFALWKFSPKDRKRDMEWDSPWGKGFPGWHLECSAMSMKYLGETLDIHGGATDLIPVHHTNEIAQSESASHKTFARYWFHTNHIIIKGTKMSKSLGNTITLEDVEKKGFAPESLRLLVLESHYRSQAAFSWETMRAAQNRLNEYKAMAQLKWQAAGSAIYDFDKLYQQILAALQDDMNTPRALLLLSELANNILENGISPANISKFDDFLQKIDSLLGLKLSDEKDITKVQKALIADRETARKAKDWAKSDEIRNTLKKQGIELRDTQFGPIWSRI